MSLLGRHVEEPSVAALPVRGSRENHRRRIDSRCTGRTLSSSRTEGTVVGEATLRTAMVRGDAAGSSLIAVAISRRRSTGFVGRGLPPKPIRFVSSVISSLDTGEADSPRLPN